MSSDERTMPRRNRAEAGVALFGFSTLVGLGLVALPLPAAEAQYYPLPWQYPYYDGYPPPVPPGGVAADENVPRVVGPDTSYGVLPLAEIRRRVALLGFHLIATPRHKGRIYLAEAEDAHGLPHRLVFDAYEGTIIENTKLAVIPKKLPVKPLAGPANVEKKGAETKAKSASSAENSKPSQNTNEK
ncbi:MAG TPA: hypothetical protein VKA03_06405 [Methylovirgula sp.]|nr:hypothetical protein [Methylovirgula sp.]